MKLHGLVASAIGATILFAASAAAATTYFGPTYPPPGGVTFTAGAGSAINPGGRTNQYSGFDLSATDDLYFGLAASLGVNSPSNLTFDLGASNLAAGIAVYDGPVPGFAGGKFIATYTDLFGAALSLTRASLAIGGGFSTSTLGGGVSGSDVAVLLVTGDFKVNQQFFLNNVAAGPEFNSWETNNHLTGNTLRSNTTGGFYYSENVQGGVPEPAGWALMILGIGGVGSTLRQRRKPSLV